MVKDNIKGGVESDWLFSVLGNLK